MTRHQLDVKALRLLGGRLCIDFVNTVEDRAGSSPHDFITSYQALVAWSRHAGLLGNGEAARLLERAERDGPAAGRAWQQAMKLREALHGTLLAIATRQAPDPADLLVVQRAYERAVAGARLTREDDHFSWAWAKEDPQLEQPLRPIALSAIELLTQGELRRVKVCANPDGCGWLFYDGSKNASRRWCRMEGCGSQVKMRRQYAKRRSTQSAAQERE